MLLQVDNREQNNKQILAYFEKNCVEWTWASLDFGDYADYFSDKKVVVELKKDLIELAQNLGKGHARFKNELERAKEQGYKMIILVRQPFNYENLPQWINPKAKGLRAMSGDIMYKIFENWKTKYDFEIKFCERKEAGKNIIEILKD